VTTIDDLETPALLLDAATMQGNIDHMARLYADARVRHRPHIKTTKCLEVARRQRAAGAIGFTCQTAAEVRLLLADGIDDLLWAQQPVGPSRVELAIEANRCSRVTCVVDSLEVAAPLSREAARRETTVPVVIEVDTGQGRCGVLAASADELAAAIERLPGLRLRGVMTHEGHVGAGAPARSEVRARGRQAGSLLAGVAARLRRQGHPIDVVSVGSTPAADSAPMVAAVTEARAGTYVFNDANQLRLGSCQLEECALTVLSTVVSNQGRDHVIIDAGLKAMSADPAATDGGYGIVLDRDGVEFPIANEEHGFLSGPARSGVSVGERLRILPNHACGTVNMWSSYWVVDGDDVVDRWQIGARY
jgi:D-serine deaminase-like pyridoxal phosphate-dependent protein